MKIYELIPVRWAKDLGKRVLMRLEDFDERVHTRWGEMTPEEKAEAEKAEAAKKSRAKPAPKKEVVSDADAKS